MNNASEETDHSERVEIFSIWEWRTVGINALKIGCSNWRKIVQCQQFVACDQENLGDE